MPPAPALPPAPPAPCGGASRLWHALLADWNFWLVRMFAGNTGPLPGEVGLRQVVTVLSHARHVLLDVLTVEPAAATAGWEVRTAGLERRTELRGVASGAAEESAAGRTSGGSRARTAAGRAGGGCTRPAPGAPDGAPAPGRRPAGRVMPCCFRHATSSARLVLEAALAEVDVELLVPELLPHPATSAARATNTTAVCDARGVSFFIVMSSLMGRSLTEQLVHG